VNGAHAGDGGDAELARVVLLLLGVMEKLVAVAKADDYRQVLAADPVRMHDNRCETRDSWARFLRL